MAYTLEDFIKLNPSYKKTYDANAGLAGVSNTDTGKSISFQSGQGAEYGFGGLQDGSNIIADPTKLTGALNTDQYASPYAPQVSDLTNKLQNRSFSYNPNTDPALKLAQKQATRNVMESMNERGILNSTVTADRTAQEVANLVPQYEQQAQNRYNTETAQLFQLANYINGLDETNYTRYKDTYNRRVQERQLAYTEAQNEITSQQKQISQAWDRVKNLGYVDNDAALILNIPVGTASYEAQKTVNDQTFELKKQERQIESQKEMEGIRFANEKTLLQLKEQNQKPKAIFDASDYFQTAVSMLKEKNDSEEPVYTTFDIIKYVIDSGATPEEKQAILTRLNYSDKDMNEYITTRREMAARGR